MEQYTPLNGQLENELEKTKNREQSLETLEQYSYFRGDQIRSFAGIDPRKKKKGSLLQGEGNVAIKGISCGYMETGEICGNASLEVKEGIQRTQVKIIFSRNRVIRASCSCVRCTKDYSRYVGTSKCEYVAASLLCLEEYLKTHNMGDATDLSGQILFRVLEEKRQNLREEAAAKHGSLCFSPRLIQKNGRLSASFRIGSGKMFVVKDLREFYDHVQNSETAVYGSGTEMNHGIDNFQEESKKWVRFISRIVREEGEFADRVEDFGFYRGKSLFSASTVELFGWRLDAFYELIGDGFVEYEDRSTGKKTKGTVNAAVNNPKVIMNISENILDSGRGFHGIQVKGVLPELYAGMETSYYIHEGTLYQVEADFMKKIEALNRISDQGEFSFQVGRNRMAEFYYRVLPQLQDTVEVRESEPEKFRSYLPPEPRFLFYLDASEENMSCIPHVRYGEREFSVINAVDAVLKHTALKEPFRDMSRELEIADEVNQWFPVMDLDGDRMHCGGDEERIYRVVEKGTDALMELGEVLCTRQFRNRNVIRPVKIAVGVSVSSGLLDLNVSTEDVSPEELLDMLSAYRQKKRYYRLKSGAYADMGSQSLEMAAELMEAMHLSPKDMIRGKMHLPMYRAMYLDRLLEENESVYSRRDSQFRKLVKGFKTVKDADFEEPDCLSETMRMYQKNGYKWLRTLESWQFGGILADDMGLGKTLQMIAVLLAAKQEGKKGRSLVIAPASLVFNWGEECKRFAPELSVSLITGSQEERRRKIDANSDVLITSYDLLKRDIALYEDYEFLYQVIDEAQYIKNHTTAAAKAVKVIHSRHRFALTGTPIENRLSELWSIFDYLMPGFLYGYDVFKREFETPIVKNGDENAMKRLQRMTAPFILRRLKQDVLKDLPEKLEEVRYVQMEKAQQRLYDAQVVHMKETIAKQSSEDFNKNKLRIFAEMTRLRQLCCDPSLCLEAYSGGSAKAEACMELIESAMDGGHRMLVFSQFTSMLEILERQCEGKGIRYFVITGETPKEKRIQLVKEFNEGDTPVFFISLKAGGVGLNLTGADVVIHYDPWWNLAAQNQATDRAHRIGQTKKVTVYKLIAKGTIEEKIRALQETKRELAEQIIGGEAAQLGSMSREELLAFLDGAKEETGSFAGNAVAP